jgi:hypothetical protein
VVLAKSLTRCDAIGAAIFGVQPYLAAYVDIDEHRTDGGASLPYELIIIHPQLRQTILEIRTLSQMFEQFIPERGGQRPETATKDSIEHFASRRSAIEYQLLTLDLEDEKVAAAATECCRIAAQIFVNMVFRKMSPGSIIHHRLSVRLRSAIIAFDKDHASQHATSILLWASVLGYLALKPGPMRFWFAGWVSHCVSELDICELEELRYQLCKITWLDPILRDPCREMWDELQQLRSMGVELRIIGDE